jgi:uncharacterized protein (DUF1800 family)
MQDGLDLIDGLCAHPETPRYLGRKLYRFFISDSGDVPEPFLARVSAAFRESRYDMKAVMREVLLAREFWDESHYFTRLSWPAEFVVRTLKDVGWSGFSLGDALAPLSNMGQNLFDPPDVAGWDVGRGWFSTGSMLARMNFASQVAANQRFNLAAAASGRAESPEALLAFVLEGLKTPPLDATATSAMLDYLNAQGPWTASAAQLQAKVPGLVHLVAGTPEYQFL